MLRNYKILFLIFMLSISGVTACTKKVPDPITSPFTTPFITPTTAPLLQQPIASDSYPDGIYRGFYLDDGIEQISIQFELKENQFQSMLFRSLQYKDGDYLSNTATPIQQQVAKQYKEATSYLIGKTIREIPDLLYPADIISDQDAVSGATLRTNKLSSSIYDGLRRGVYTRSDTTKLQTIPSYPDGIYRGFYYDDRMQQIAIQFTIKENRFEAVSFRDLAYKDGDYLSETATDVQLQVAAQYEVAFDYLVGKPLSAVNDLYDTKTIVPDMDAVTGATLRVTKLISAIHDGLNRGVYKTIPSTVLPTIPTVADGTYRGFFTDDNLQQISVDVTIKDGTFQSILLRTLQYKDGNYLESDDDERKQQVRSQYEQAIHHLIGTDISTLSDLYSPNKIVTDFDAVSAATLRSTKLVSAILDAFNRGIYKESYEEVR